MKTKSDVSQAKKDGKTVSLRECDGPESLEERRTCKTLLETGSECSGTTSNTKKDTEQSRRCVSVSDGSSKALGHLAGSFVVRLEKQVTQFQRTVRTKETILWYVLKAERKFEEAIIEKGMGESTIDGCG